MNINSSSSSSSAQVPTRLSKVGHQSHGSDQTKPDGHFDRVDVGSWTEPQAPPPGRELPTWDELPAERRLPSNPNPPRVDNVLGKGLLFSAAAAGMTGLLTQNFQTAMFVGASLGVGTGLVAFVNL